MNNMNMNNMNMNNLNNMNLNNNLNTGVNNYMNNNIRKSNTFKGNINFMNNMVNLSNSFDNMSQNNLQNSWNSNNNTINNQNQYSINRANSSNINFNVNNNVMINNFVNKNISNNNNEITIKFAFMACQVFNIKAKLNEKLCDVIKRFKDNECPNQLKEHLSIPLHGGQPIKDQNKTLSELGIKNQEIVLFIIKKKKDEEKIDNKEKSEHKLTEDELIQIKKWLEEYEAMKFIKNMLNSQENIENENNGNLVALDTRESIHNFLDFVKQKERCGSITVKEHNHKLVYCITIHSWKCNLCNKKYDKKNARYYCSICDFNMCDECHSKGDYIKKKFFQKVLNPQMTLLLKNLLKLIIINIDLHIVDLLGVL